MFPQSFEHRQWVYHHEEFRTVETVFLEEIHREMAFASDALSKIEEQPHPPLGDTKLIALLTSASGESIQPSILAKIDKGFFRADENWTCYRRNYFSIACSFILEPETLGPLYLYLGKDNDRKRVLSFAMLISARTGFAEDSLTSVNLIQYGPKDKGHMGTPRGIRMRPQVKGSNENYIVESEREQADAISYYIQGPEVTVFDRLKFRTATANNGRRAALQQYFYLIVELWAIIDDEKEQSIKIATRTSVPLVVQGRSPRSYQDESRSSIALYNPELTAEAWEHVMDDQDPRDRRASVKTESSRDNTVISSPRLELPRGIDHFPPSLDRDGIRIQFPAGPVLGDVLAGGVSNGISSLAQLSNTITGLASPTTLHQDHEENSSISSVSGLFPGSALSSVSSFAGPAEAADYLVSLILGDSGLKALCTDGFAMLDADRFERNLRRLLKIFATDLRRKAFHEFEVVAARFVKARVRYVASAIRSTVDPSSCKRAKDLERLLDKTIEKKKLIEQYLDQPYEPKIYDAETVDAVSNSISSDDQYDKGPSGFLDFEQAKEFLSNGDAFEDLREGLMGFLIPILVAGPKYNDHKMSLLEPKAGPPLEKHAGVTAGLQKKMRALQAVCQEIVKSYCALGILVGSKLSSHPEDPLALELDKLTDCLSLNIEEKMTKRNHTVLNNSARLNQEENVLHMLTDTGIVLETLQERVDREYTRTLQERYQHRRPHEHIEQELSTASIAQPLTGTSLVDHKSQNEFCIDNLAKGPSQTHQASKEQFPTLQCSVDDLRSQTTQLMAFLDNLVQESSVVTTDSLIPSSSIPTNKPEDLKDFGTSLAMDSKDFSENPLEYARAPTSIKVATPDIKTIVIMVKQLCIIILRDVMNSITRPNIRPGYRRIEWICDCGEPLWGDFDGSRPQALTALSEYLNRPTSCASTSPQNHRTVDLNPPSATHAVSSVQTSQENTTVLGSTSHHHEPLTDSKPRSSQVPFIEKYLELCVNTGEYEVTLAEIEISTAQSSITSDGQLFQEIRKEYNQHRSFLKVHSLHLFKPVEVRFVQFCLEDGDIGILKTPLSLPHEEDIRSREWEFCPCPCPLKEPPPIPNNIFLHHLNSKRTHPRSTWLDRLPKKLNRSIHQIPDPDTSHIGWQAHGWGIQIIEGPNERAVLWLTGGIVSASLAAALVWAFLKGDVQGAFGIGGFIVASASMLVFAFFNYHHGRSLAKA